MNYGDADSSFEPMEEEGEVETALDATYIVEVRQEEGMEDIDPLDQAFYVREYRDRKMVPPEDMLERYV